MTVAALLPNFQWCLTFSPRSLQNQSRKFFSQPLLPSAYPADEPKLPPPPVLPPPQDDPTNCIFHSDPGPSMVLYTGQNKFYCYGCEAHGDSWDLQKREDITGRHAL
jgi:hypothetical protein